MKVYNDQRRYTHIVKGHLQDVITENKIRQIKTVIEKPDVVKLKKDKNGHLSLCFARMNLNNTLFIIIRYDNINKRLNVITAFKLTNDTYNKFKTDNGGIVWKP